MMKADLIPNDDEQFVAALLQPPSELTLEDAKKILEVKRELDALPASARVQHKT